MVAHSELAFRTLAFEHGATLAYTPMMHAKHFAASANYRSGNFDFDPSIEGAAHGRPVIAQIAANDPELASQAVRILASTGVDGIDLNLGCPQGIARKGNYGAFLLPQTSKVEAVLSAMVAASDGVPITAKVRIQDDLESTLRICKAIQSTGVSLLTVHGRTRENNKTNLSPASHEAIRAVVESLDIPVVANGGVERPEDVPAILESTGAAGVMSSEKLLELPSLFAPGAVGDAELTELEVMERQLALTREYLVIAAEHFPISYGGAGGANCVKSHVFKMMYRLLDLPPCHGLRAKLGGMKDRNYDVSNVAAVVEEVAALLHDERRPLLTNESVSWYRRHRRPQAPPPTIGSVGTMSERKARIRERVEKLRADRITTAATD
ncbi:hypothetical protein TeGR_g10226 [Tetraparma gracilis]|uniref:tRNA-dihydrouridine(16/17) synthase [NAD(P)(+)] n=1 Tax=Tetraparma gracilis TaxID=2962635 RepID=A0ABQ6MJM5_9STRA|nr:hypothetical protein TeGR_g10226 [Tetraparma gracilis]